MLPLQVISTLCDNRVIDMFVWHFYWSWVFLSTVLRSYVVVRALDWLCFEVRGFEVRDYFLSLCYLAGDCFVSVLLDVFEVEGLGVRVDLLVWAQKLVWIRCCWYASAVVGMDPLLLVWIRCLVLSSALMAKQEVAMFTLRAVKSFTIGVMTYGHTFRDRSNEDSTLIVCEF